MKKLSKIFVLMLVGILMISMLPGVLAEDQEESDIEENEEVIEELAEETNSGKGYFYKLRERMFEAQQNRFDRQQERQEYQAEFHQEKADIAGLRSDLVECIQSSEDKEECAEVREEVKDAAHDHLIGTAEHILAAIEQLEEKVENHQNLDEDTKETVLAELEEQKLELEATLSELEELDENSETEEIRTALQNLKDSWHKARPTIHWTIGILSNSALDNLLEKATTTSERLADKISSYEEEGYDVSDLETLKDDFDIQLALAEEANDKAEEAILAVDPSEELNGELQEAHELQKEARDYLKEREGLPLLSFWSLFFL